MLEVSLLLQQCVLWLLHISRPSAGQSLSPTREVQVLSLMGGRWTMPSPSSCFSSAADATSRTLVACGSVALRQVMLCFFVHLTAVEAVTGPAQKIQHGSRAASWFKHSVWPKFLIELDQEDGRQG